MQNECYMYMYFVLSKNTTPVTHTHILTCSNSESLSLSTSADQDVMSFIVLWHRVITVNPFDSKLGNSFMNPFSSEGGHSCINISTVPCGFSLITVRKVVSSFVASSVDCVMGVVNEGIDTPPGSGYCGCSWKWSSGVGKWRESMCVCVCVCVWCAMCEGEGIVINRRPWEEHLTTVYTRGLRFVIAGETAIPYMESDSISAYKQQHLVVQLRTSYTTIRHSHLL